MNAFVIAGAILAVWAVLVSLIGMRGFPRSKGAERAAIAITVILFAGAVGSAIADQTKVGERHGPHKEEPHGEKEPGVEGAASPEPAPDQGGTQSEEPGSEAAPGAQGDTSQSAGKPTELALQADPNAALAFDKTELEAPAGPVTIVMTNPSPVPHDVAIRGGGVDQKGEIVSAGGKSTVEAELKPGSYEFYCSVPGHEPGGMKGTLTVK